MAAQGPYFDKAGMLPIWVPPPPAPVLGFTLLERGLELEWGSDLYCLQHKAQLDHPNWQDYRGGETSPVMVPPQDAGHFFRLRRKSSRLEDFGASQLAMPNIPPAEFPIAECQFPISIGNRQSKIGNWLRDLISASGFAGGDRDGQ